MDRLHRVAMLYSLVFLVLLGVWASPAAAHHSVNALDVPTAGGAYGFTSFGAINDRGQILGYDLITPASYVLTNVINPVIDVLACPNSVSTVGTALNRFGEVVGWCDIPAPSPLSVQGFVRTRHGRYLFLRHPDAMIQTIATGINAQRQVVGYHDRDGDVAQGFLWENRHFTPIVLPFADVVETFPMAINRDGDIAGFYRDNQVSEDFPDGHVHGFVIRAGVASRLDVPAPDILDTIVDDMNDRGQILGRFWSATSGGNFFLDKGTYYYAPIPGPALATITLHGLNNLGRLVGHSLLYDPTNTTDPTYESGIISSWDPTHATVIPTVSAAVTATARQMVSAETPRGICAQLAAAQHLQMGKLKGLARRCQK